MLGGEAWIVAIVSRIQELRPEQESKEQEDRARFKQGRIERRIGRQFEVESRVL
jgi:uncharacterized membrane protein